MMEFAGTLTLLVLLAMPNSDRNSMSEGYVRIGLGLATLAAIWG
jgi:hypothetical protein